MDGEMPTHTRHDTVSYGAIHFNQPLGFSNNHTYTYGSSVHNIGNWTEYDNSFTDAGYSSTNYFRNYILYGIVYFLLI